MEGNTDPERVAEQDAGGLQCVGKREHGAVHDPTVYERDILPKIQGMSVRLLVALTGLSEYYLWQVRKGEKRLHARFWERIASA